MDYADVKTLTGERCALVVDLGAVRKNAEYLIKKTGKKLIAVVKADAYGNGAQRVVEALKGLSALFAVATADEALAVAEQGAKALVMSPLSEAETEKLKGREIAVCVSDEEEAALAAKHGIPVHVAVDTGMHRYGADMRDVGKLLRICDCDGVKTQGIYTHFPCADCEDFSLTEAQKAGFARAVSVLGARRFSYVHCANGAAALRAQVFGNAVRAGLALYGVNPSCCVAPLSEVSRLYARVLSVRLVADGESVGYGGAYTANGIKRIAVIGAGYADGLPYSEKNSLSVFINGFICPVVGRVCMDCAFVDVTFARAEKGDYALVIGGEGETGYAAVARKTGALPYSVMTGISARVPRLYVR